MASPMNASFKWHAVSNITCRKYFSAILITISAISFSNSCCFSQRNILPCQSEPAFIKKLGFDPLWSALSSSEKQKTGIVLVELLKENNQTAPTLQSKKGRIYQDSSWSSAGYLSTITFDAQGNIYSIPAPLISMIFNKPKDQNIIYRIDAFSGKMSAWLPLPFCLPATAHNPYGLLGLTYDCISHNVFAASIGGSSKYEEKGIIFHIETKTKKILDTLKGIDAMGLAVNFDEKGIRRLYFGKTRTGEILSVPIADNGKFLRNKMRSEFSLEGLGIRGDDKPRKIKFTNGLMEVSGIEFNYNLQAASEKPETVYFLKWNHETNQWVLVNVN